MVESRESPEQKLDSARYYPDHGTPASGDADAGSNVMVTAADRDVSLLQSELARQASEAKKLDPGGLEVKFGTGLGGGDWFGWLRSLLDWVDRREAHPIVVRPTSRSRNHCPKRRGSP